MRYFGGKVRLARELASVINQYKVESYHEPFCGMYSVGSHITAAVRSGADNQEDLILLLQAVQTGWAGPEFLSEDEYEFLKSVPACAMRAFAGFGCSNSGKFFGGYARESTARNFAANARSSLLKLAPKIKDVEFWYEPYVNFDDPCDLIYCDPPYVNTTGFTTGDFDTEEFWSWAYDRAKHSIVLVSEYVAPSWTSVVWEKKVRTDMNSKSGKIPRVEKLFRVQV